MADKNKAVFGIYPNRPSVEEAVQSLRASGFRVTDISVLFQDNQGTKDLAHKRKTQRRQRALLPAVWSAASRGACSGG